MTAGRRGLMARLLGWQFLNEFIPFFGVYALLFDDSGLSLQQISWLFVIWSLVAIVSEIPSGAWADVLPRRLLLAVAALLYGACFAAWVLLPTGAGFVLGFVLWGISGALSSGTFQAFAYDELAAVGATDRYARVIGWGYTLSLIAVAAATALSAPLYALGGFTLVGVVSVVVCLAQLALVLLMPEAPRTISAADVADLDDDLDESGKTPVPGPVSTAQLAHRPSHGAAPPFLSSEGSDTTEPNPSATASVWLRWGQTLAEGVRVSAGNRIVRGGVLASATLMGLLAFDEYFGLLLREQGVTTAAVPILLTLVAAAQATGALLAERAQRWGARTVGALVVLGGLAIAAGAISGRPVGVIGVALGYGVLTLLIILAEVRLQHCAPTEVRATVLSTSSLLAEVLAVAIFLVFALVADAGVGLVLAALSLGVALLGPAVAVWMPPPAGGELRSKSA